MKKRWLVATILLLPTLVLVNYMNCAPMKSSLEIPTVDVTANSSLNICDSSYNPPSNLVSKATPISKAAAKTSIFDNQKVHIDVTRFASKASTNSENQIEIVVILDTDCAQKSNSNFIKKILAESATPLQLLPKQSFTFKISSTTDFSTLEEQMQNEPCVVGVVNHENVQHASLSLPPTNDPDVSKQTHLQTINYYHAYKYLASQQTGAQPTSIIAFVDTGVDCSHSDLQQNLVANCGYNAMNPANPPDDNDGHGSHTAGLANAVTNNAIGITGMAGMQVKIFPIKVIDVDTGTITDLYNGIQFAISQHVDVLNISIQSQVQLPSIEQAVTDAVNAGIVVTMAAGNFAEELSASSPVSPALVGSQLDGAIAVGSIDASSGQLSNFSNYGNLVEMATTGSLDSTTDPVAGGIYSLNYSNRYQRLSGTSQASPIMGAAAVMLIQFLKAHTTSYSPAVIEDILKKSSDITSININQGRVINFSKLTRNAYAYANVQLCSNGQPLF